MLTPSVRETLLSVITAESILEKKRGLILEGTYKRCVSEKLHLLYHTDDDIIDYNQRDSSLLPEQY
jgi:hypothetical protein